MRKTGGLFGNERPRHQGIAGKEVKTESGRLAVRRMRSHNKSGMKWLF